MPPLLVSSKRAYQPKLPESKARHWQIHQQRHPHPPTSGFRPVATAGRFLIDRHHQCTKCIISCDMGVIIHRPACTSFVVLKVATRLIKSRRPRGRRGTCPLVSPWEAVKSTPVLPLPPSGRCEAMFVRRRHARRAVVRTALEHQQQILVDSPPTFQLYPNLTALT